MNILILSAGTRNKIVQYFKRELGNEGKVIATDCSNLAPAVYDADRFYLVPRISEPGYLDLILDICRKENVDGVFSLIDPELSLLAKEKERFLEVGAKPVISSCELVETCFDKYVKNLSFAMDMKVLWLTVKTVLGHSGEVAEDTHAVEGNFAQIRKQRLEETGRLK